MIVRRIRGYCRQCIYSKPKEFLGDESLEDVFLTCLKFKKTVRHDDGIHCSECTEELKR